mgnify:FL=1
MLEKRITDKTKMPIPLRPAPPATHPAPAPQPRVSAWADRLWGNKGWALAAVGALLLAYHLLVPFVLGTPLIVDVAVRGDFVQSVVASGHVEAPYRVDIGSQVTGVVADVPVREGQQVKAGDVLVVLDDREARTTVVQAEGVVAQAEARLRQMQEVTQPSAEQSLKQAQATLLNSQRAYDRSVKLAGDGFATKAALDEATKNLDIARTQVRNAEFQVFTSRSGGSDYVMAETQLAQARAALATAQSRLGYTTIKAPRDGVLISRSVERGNVVQPTTVLMKLSPAGETQLVVQIDEKNLALIAVGQTALASADAYAKSTFPADVVFINPGIDLQRASVQVKLRVPSPPAYLREDMTVSVDIETARRPNALVLPAAAIRDATAAKPWVMVVESGRARRRAIELGMVSAGKAEIVAGVEAGEFVLSASSKVKDGQRVRPTFAVSAKP